MLRASIIFFVLAIVSMLLGMNSIAGLSVEIGKILLLVFLVLSILSFFLGRRGKVLAIAFLSLLSTTSVINHQAYADESVKDTIKEAGNDTGRAAKNAVRVTKDAACKLVNGKTECAVQKAKHAVQKGADNVEDAID